MKDAERQLDHLRWHGDRLDHWHVGVTALDGAETLTEDVTEFYGCPVYRLPELDRDQVIAVGRGEICHPRGWTA